MKYHVLYRGPLSSCNYDCHYCPFAKRSETHHQLEGDRISLQRFLDWLDHQQHRTFGILLTPWGEALVRSWYQDAMVRMSWMPHVERVAIQTNLSCRLDWIDRTHVNRVAFWATYHPDETNLADFSRRVETVMRKGARISVGCVGMKANLAAIQELRQALPPEIYVWINAYKREVDYYSAADIALLESIDPHFQVNNHRHPSLGQACHAGETSFTVDGSGNIRRCHFIDEVIGRIDDPVWEDCLQPRTCSNATCGCHIGYVHLKRLNLYPIYQDGILERIPAVGRSH